MSAGVDFFIYCWKGIEKARKMVLKNVREPYCNKHMFWFYDFVVLVNNKLHSHRFSYTVVWEQQARLFPIQNVCWKNLRKHQCCCFRFLWLVKNPFCSLVPSLKTSLMVLTKLAARTTTSSRPLWTPTPIRSYPNFRKVTRQVGRALRTRKVRNSRWSRCRVGDVTDSFLTRSSWRDGKRTGETRKRWGQMLCGG